MFYSDKCVGCGECRRFCGKAFTASCVRCGRCADVRLHNARKRCGYDIDLDKLFAKVLSDRDFYEESGGGVTISGGEPLLQAEFVGNILKMCRSSGIHTAVETAGFVPFESFEKVLPHTDLFLYDIKCINESLHKRLTGVSNVPTPLQTDYLHQAKHHYIEICESIARSPRVQNQGTRTAAQPRKPFN